MTQLPAWLAMEFPQRLVALRKANSLTQRQLSERIGVHLNQIQRYENGTSQPTLDVLRRLAIALSVSADLLLFDKDERGPDDALRLQFEALRQFDADELQVAQQVLESLILKHQARQMVLRTQHPPSAATEKKRAASGRRR
jgi:transcriptional regulator with XRE-family HTH domain